MIVMPVSCAPSARSARPTLSRAVFDSAPWGVDARRPWHALQREAVPVATEAQGDDRQPRDPCRATRRALVIIMNNALVTWTDPRGYRKLAARAVTRARQQPHEEQCRANNRTKR